MPTATKTSRVRRLAGKPAPRPAARLKISWPWALRNARGLQILELAAFREFPWLIHGFSTRVGGASHLDSGEPVLNLGFTDWDSRENVLKNRGRFQSAIGGCHAVLVPLKQFHSAVVHPFKAAPKEPCRGDALVTQAPGLLLGVQTADCLPILLVDPNKRVVAAIHAGWRGTLARIAQKTVGEMRMRFACKPGDILAALGPAIGACCYKVGTELVAQFTSQFADAEQYFDELRTGEEPNPLQWLNRMPPGHQPPPSKVRLDLPKANRLQLLAAGLRDANIFVSELCTACHAGLFFSYRRESAHSGRQLSAVAVRT